MAERHYESAHEEFARRVKELYQLADKMGLRLTVKVRARRAEADSQRRREPGEN
jgi:hypothetical protein